MARDFDSLREKLLRELGESASADSSNRDWTKELKKFLETNDQEFKQIGLDIAVVFGTVGAWKDARACIRRFRKLDSANISALIFEMRCLYELESFTEVLALGQSPMSEKHHLLSANYL